MAIIEDDSKSLRKCDWCGKSSISSTWSGKRGIYCSFRCSAAGSYRMYALISIIVSMMTVLLVVMMAIMQNESSTSQPIPLFLMFPIFLLIGLNLSFIYSAYVGWSMRKE